MTRSADFVSGGPLPPGFALALDRPGLVRLLDGVAQGHFPEPHSRVRLAPLAGPAAAVLAFPAHFVVAAPVDAGWLADRLPDPSWPSPLAPQVLVDLADLLGAPAGESDAVLVAPPLAEEIRVPEPSRVPLRELDPAEAARHARVARADRYRDEVRAWTTPDGAGVLTLGRGVAGRWETSFEVLPAARGAGLGTLLALAARTLAGPAAPVWAQVTPGNAHSLRAVLAAGYRPVGQEVLFALR